MNEGTTEVRTTQRYCTSEVHTKRRYSMYIRLMTSKLNYVWLISKGLMKSVVVSNLKISTNKKSKPKESCSTSEHSEENISL